uniref:Uncharacterized protein n=1 Tax=Oncorhynchus kisutch TaxID=8019 RepID=A0A8C7HBW7_ONCKI
MGSRPGSVVTGRDREVRGATHNWPSIVRVREGLACRDVLVPSRTSDSCGGPGAVSANQGCQVHGVSSDTLVRLASGLDARCVKKQCGLVGLCIGGQKGQCLLLSGEKGQCLLLSGEKGQCLLLSGEKGQCLLLSGEKGQCLLLSGEKGQCLLLSGEKGQCLLLSGEKGQCLLLSGEKGQCLLLSGEKGQCLLLTAYHPPCTSERRQSACLPATCILEHSCRAYCRVCIVALILICCVSLIALYLFFIYSGYMNFGSVVPEQSQGLF